MRRVIAALSLNKHVFVRLTLLVGRQNNQHTDANSLTSIKIRRDIPTKKPELTDQEIIDIRQALQEEPEWMRVSFEISLNTGCRLRETRIPLPCINFEENKITFPSPKGGEDRAFSIPMPTAVNGLLLRLATEGR